jgi:CMP-N,N'-diacetyllegionaminic acid synthase
MFKGKKVLALIPARGGSKGLPGKNVRTFCGKPLIAWSVEQAAACPFVDSVVVSTDSETIASIAVAAGARAPFLRPAQFASDTATSVDVILHALDFLRDQGEEYDILVLIEPTSPLREVSDIVGALQALREDAGVTSVVSVVQAEAAHPAYLFGVDGTFLRPMLGVDPNGLRRQDLSGAYYYLEGSVYVSAVDALRENRGFCHKATAPWVVSRYKAVEIDELCDFIMAEALMMARIKGELA